MLLIKPVYPFVTEPNKTDKGAVLGYGVKFDSQGYNGRLKVIDILKNRQGNSPKIIGLEDRSLIINK